MAALLPAYTYLAAWFALAGVVYIVLGIETKGRSLESIEKALEASRPAEIAHVKAEENR